MVPVLPQLNSPVFLFLAVEKVNSKMILNNTPKILIFPSLLSVQRSLEMKTIICLCSLFNLWVLNFLVPSVVCTSLTPQSAHSYCLWALQRLYLQPSLLLWRPCMTWRYFSLLAYHKSASSHSFSFVFSCCFIWNANMYQEPKPSFEFPSITQKVVRIGFGDNKRFLTNRHF